jgi:hypothetical protein
MLIHLVLALINVSVTQGSGVDAKVNANPIGIEDTLELVISLDAPQGESYPEVPPVDGLKRTGSFYRYVSGGRPTYVFQFSPQKVGHYKIGPVLIRFNNEEHRTEPLNVEVVAGTVSPRSHQLSVPKEKKVAPRSDQIIAIGATLPNEQVKVNEVFELVVEIDGVRSGGPLAPLALTLHLPDGIRENGRTTFHGVKMKGGRLTDHATVTCRLVAESEGLFEIDSIVLEHEGKSYRADPVSVEVVRP